jgi:hypothetical protein
MRQPELDGEQATCSACHNFCMAIFFGLLIRQSSKSFSFATAWVAYCQNRCSLIIRSLPRRFSLLRSLQLRVLLRRPRCKINRQV